MNICGGNYTSSKIDKTITRYFNNKWDNYINAILVYPNPKIFLSLICNFVEYFELNLQRKKDPLKRTSILIVTRNKNLLRELSELRINKGKIFDYSKNYYSFLNNKDIFCDMNDKTFSMVYWHTYLSQYYENEIPDNIPLTYIFPIATGRKKINQISRGHYNFIGRNDNVQPPTFIFTNSIKTINLHKGKFDKVFVDGSTVKSYLNNLDNKEVPYLIMINNPLDSRIPYLLSEKRNNYIIDNLILQRMNEKTNDQNHDLSKVKFKYVKSQFEDTVLDAMKLLNKLYSIQFNSDDLKNVRTLLYNAIRMVIEGVEYDLIATFDPSYSSIRELLKEIKTSDFRYESDEFEQVIELVEDIYNKHELDKISPKYNELTDILQRSIKEKQNTLIVTSGKINSLGLKEKVSKTFTIDIEDLNKNGINIKTYQDIMALETSYDVIILTSALRISELQPILKCNYNKMIVLMYKAEIKEMKNKLGSLINIKNDFAFIKDETIYQLLYKKINRIDSNKKEDFLVPMGDLLDSIKSLNYNFKNRLNNSYQPENAVNANLVTFTDGTKSFLQPTSTINILVKNERKFTEKQIKELNGNEEVLLLDNSVRKDLYEVFIKNLSENSKTKEHYQIIQEWRIIYEEYFIVKECTDEKLYDRMTSFGWNKKTIGILKNWRLGYSYGPRDLEDIKILGQALKIKLFVENAEYYHEAMESIRSERRITARLLNKVIYLSKSNSLAKTDNQVLEKYGLSVEELQDSINIKRIQSVSKKLYSVKPSEIGCIFK